MPKPQIVLESRLEHDVSNDCLMTIDGTDFRIQQKGAARKGNLFGFQFPQVRGKVRAPL